MIRLLFIVFALLMPMSLVAQQHKTDTAKMRAIQKKDTALQQINKSADSLRSIAKKLAHLQDSLKPGKKYRNKLDSLQRKLHASDSLKPDTGKYKSKLDSLRGRLHQNDSLRPDISKHSRKLDSIKGRITHRIDSLKAIGQPTGKYTKMLDSLKQAGPLKNINKAKTKLDSLENGLGKVEKKISAPVNKVESKINEKLSLMNKEGGAGANVPGSIDLPNLPTAGGTSPSLSGTDLKLPDVGANVPGADLKLPNTDISNPLNQVGNPLNDVKNPIGEIDGFGNVQDQVKDISNLPQEKLGQLNEFDQLKKGQEVMGQVDNVSGKIEGYSEDAKNLSTGNLGKMEEMPKELEGKVGKLEEVQGIQKEMQGIDKYKDMTGKMQDEEAMKKMALEEAKKQAVDHFEGKGDQVKSAMGHVSKLKQKYSSLNSLQDIPKKVPNEMKGKPLIERVVPGLTLQLQKNNNVLIDYNPSAGYRLSGRWTVGLGWNERLSIGKKFKLNHQDRIYGPRAYVDFKIKKDFVAMTAVEKMNTYIPPLNALSVDSDSRAWVWSVFVGFKKEYKFFKNVNGNFQFLYNLYDDHYNSPYADRLVVRTGFEFPQRKKVRVKKEKD